MKNEKINYSTKLFRNKKGINDISIIALIIFVFLGTSIIIPFVNNEFATTGDIFNSTIFEQNVKDDAENVNVLSAFEILITTLKLAFFDFGNTLGLPFWLDAIYSILAIIFILVIARNIWVGGGG